MSAQWLACRPVVPGASIMPYQSAWLPGRLETPPPPRGTQVVTDDLTGLGNRRLLYRQLDTALAHRAEGRSVALLIVDLDRFKEINDALGHHMGDQLLRQIGPRLASQLRTDDLLVRLGGDEFAVLLADRDPASATTVAQRLLDALEEPFDLEGVALHVDASIGLALCPDHAGTPIALLQRADVAMYQAKAGHHGWQTYALVGQHQARDRLQTIEDLRAALAGDELLVHYQPKIDPRAHNVVGVEALVRWSHPTQGLLYPDTFLPLAEQTGLMRQLTLVVLQTALRQGQAWRQAGLDLPVAVNLSVANLLDAHLARQVGDLLAGLRLPARALELELTEDTLMADRCAASRRWPTCERWGCAWRSTTTAPATPPWPTSRSWPSTSSSSTSRSSCA